MALRIIDNNNRCMQRLGFLKYVVYKCSQQDSIGINDLGKDLIDKVTKKYPVHLTSELQEYITKRLTDSVYKNLRESVKNIEIKNNVDQTFFTELQDQYLSSNEIVSKTGKLIQKDQEKYPYLLSSLSLVRKSSYSLLVRGKVFLEFINRSEIDAFNKFDIEVNPLTLTTVQQILLLYSFLENDGDTLKQLYTNLVKKYSSFSDRQAGDLLPSIYRNLVGVYNATARSGEEKDKLIRLSKSAETIEKWKNRSYTGKGAREESITVRLEPFVDLGLLTKTDPYRYEYWFNKEGKLFFELFSDSSDVETFMNQSFFSSLSRAFQFSAVAASNREILKIIYLAYEKIKSALGYAPVKEIALMSAIQSIVHEKKYFEIGQAISIISKYQKENPYDLRFQVDRSGDPVYVKFLKKIDELTQ